MGIKTGSNQGADFAVIKTLGYTVATLPASQQNGSRAFVTDALTPVWGSAAVGGGAVIVPVFKNASTWIVG